MHDKTGTWVLKLCEGYSRQTVQVCKIIWIWGNVVVGEMVVVEWTQGNVALKLMMISEPQQIYKQPSLLNFLKQAIDLMDQKIGNVHQVIHSVICIQLQQQMSNLHGDLAQRMELVKWEEGFPRQKFDLMTIRSLLIDDLPKFKQLKQIITNFNAEKKPDRIRYQQPFIQQLFKVLSQLTRLETTQEQLDQLDKVHLWATKGDSGEDRLGDGTKSRPGTASTRTRPNTAKSRPQTGISRPGTGKSYGIQAIKESIEMTKNDPRINYDKLREGDKEFFSGARTLHPELAEPRKRLRDYERVKLQEDEAESDIQIIELQEKPILKEIEISEQQLIDELGEDPEVIEEGAEDPNIDDIPLEGEEDGAAIEEIEEEEKIVVDKLKPKNRVYGAPAGTKVNQKGYQGGMNELERVKNYGERRLNEDKDIVTLQVQWAQGRGRAKSEMMRRAQSARVVTKRIGVPVKKDEIEPIQRENIVSFQNFVPAEVSSKKTRPVTAFNSDRQKQRQQIIKNAFLVSKLEGHVGRYAEDFTNKEKGSLTVLGVKPKRKCFEEILRDAQERVIREAQEEVVRIKDVCSHAKVEVALGKIGRSITHAQRELPCQWVGTVTGMGMSKNPFIKVTKKKKKKKKK